MSHRKKTSTLELILEALLALILFAVRVIAWLIRVIPQIIYFFWSICGYSKSEYHQVTHTPLPQLVFDKGAYGEYLIYRHLDKKLKEDHKWLFNIYLPRGNDRTTEIDVMLFCGSGIYVFESKNYKGWIFGSENRRVWTQCIKPSEKTRARKYRFLNPIMQNKLHLACFKKQLTEEQLTLPVHSVILFGNRCNLKKIELTSGRHTVIRLKQITAVVDLTSASCSTAAWQTIYELLYPMTQVSEAVKQKHIDDINAEINRDESSDHLYVPDTDTLNIPDVDNLYIPMSSEPYIPNADGLYIPPAKKEVPADATTNETPAKSTTSLSEETPKADTSSVEICPLCQGKLVTRTAHKGPNQGKTFLGCSNFPRCRYTK